MRKLPSNWRLIRLKIKIDSLELDNNIYVCQDIGCDIFLPVIVLFDGNLIWKGKTFWSKKCMYMYLYHVIKFVSALWRVGGFIGVLQFPPPKNLTATIQGFQSGPVPGTFTRLRSCIVPAEITEPPKISGGQNHKYDGR